ncbi:MAG: hypothetical protein JRI25_14265 [Deltaproteobacteria bacterium]|nr:hypothetical protein [Deltaproteobacteria bacterium]
MGGGPGEEVCSADTIRLPNPVSADGGMEYYRNRHDDFVSRYTGCDAFTPPSYYLEYGDKYIRRFTLELKPRLSPEGQAWCEQAGFNLQEAIEDHRADNGKDYDQLEKNDAAFTSFAYATHADAYWRAGLGDLGIFDLARIGLTPDIKDLVTWEGVTQVLDVGTRLLGAWGERAIDYAAGEGTTQELIQAAYEGFELVGDGIDEVFGEGTAAELVEDLEDLGRRAADLAEEAHGVVYRGGEIAVDAIDSVLGEGTVEGVVEGGREMANEAVDWAEDTWDSIWD